MSHSVRSLGIARRSAAIIVLGAAALLSACQTDLPDSDDRSRATKALRIDESIVVFSDLCLATSITEADAERVAKDAEFGLEIAYRKRRSGTPFIALVGRKGSADGAFLEYRCSVHFQGKWADSIVARVGRELSSRGFKAVRSFSRESGKNGYPPLDTITHAGSFERGGKRYQIAVRSWLPGRTQTHRYIANTAIVIVTE